MRRNRSIVPELFLTCSLPHATIARPVGRRVMAREYGYGQSQSQEPMVWDRVEWRQGDGRYVFEVAQGGLHATLAPPHGTKLTLPMVACEGLLDALVAARKTKA